MSVSVLLSTILFFCVILASGLEFRYHNNTEIYKVLQNFDRIKNGNVWTKLYSIGKTKNGNELWVLMITATKPGKVGVPNVKLIGNMHGNEAAGREILLQFIEFLKNNYKTDKEVQWLLNHTKIHIMPTMNPDGFERASQGNCRGTDGRTNGYDDIDLNRDFPDPFHKNLVRNAPESIAVRRWMEKYPFVLSAALHGGALVANYPFDSLKLTKSDGVVVESPTPDNDVFKHLATVYSQNHLSMHKGNKTHLGSPCDLVFQGGITNGAKWYSFEGSMGDFNYDKYGCMELTLEISCCKYPKANLLQTLWMENKQALLKYCIEANKGIAGQIVDSLTGKPIENAHLSVVGRDKTFYSFKKTGEFWRLLLPGKYNLRIKENGYNTKIVPFEVPKYVNSFPVLEFKRILLDNATVFTTTTTTTSTTKATIVNKKINPHTERPDFREFTDSEQPVVLLAASTDSSGNHNLISYYRVFLYAILLYLYL